MSRSKNKDLHDIIKWAIPVIICIVILIVVKIVCSVMKNPDEDTLRQQEEQMIELQNDITIAQNQLSDKEALSKNAADLNVYNGEPDPNDEVATAFFKNLCTYEDGETYENLRLWLQTLGYTDESSVVNCFVPKQDITYDLEGHREYGVDKEKQNMTFKSLTSYRLYVDGGTSHYAGIVTVSTNDLSGEAVGYNSFTASTYVTYEIVNGEILNVEAEALMS